MENLASYIREDSLVERVNERMRVLHMSIQQLSVETGKSRPTLSRYLNGTYNANPAAVEQTLAQWLEATQGRLEDYRQAGLEVFDSLPEKPEYYPSTDYLSVIGLCKRCQEEQGLGMLVGKSGTGKTYTLKHYAKFPRVAYVECDDAMGKKDLLEAIEMAIGMPATYGTVWKRLNRIREFFNVNSGFLLIIDEADKLTSRDTTKKMEIIRGIYDQAGVGVLIAGEPKLAANVKGYLPRLANRTDFYYKMSGLSKKEVAGYFDSFQVEEDAMRELMVRACNPNTGCFRLLDRTVNNILRILKESGQNAVTMQVITEASAMMML